MVWATWSKCSNNNAVVLEMLVSQAVDGKGIHTSKRKTDSVLAMTGLGHSDNYDFTHFLV